MKDKLTPDDLRRWAGISGSCITDYDEFVLAFRDLTPLERRQFIDHCRAWERELILARAHEGGEEKP